MTDKERLDTQRALRDWATELDNDNLRTNRHDDGDGIVVRRERADLLRRLANELSYVART